MCCCLLFVLAGSVPGRRLRVDLIVGVLAVRGAPTALQGALVGIGFIGAGLVFRQPKGRLPLIRNRTTAAAIFAAAAIGAAAGEGRLLLGYRWHGPRAAGTRGAAHPAAETAG